MVRPERLGRRNFRCEAYAAFRRGEMTSVLSILRDAFLPNRGWRTRAKASDRRLVVWALRVLLVLAAIVIGSYFGPQTHRALH